MSTYSGFSTVNTGQTFQTSTTPATFVGKKFRLTDERLVIQDFINALNIQLGQKVGNPGYGTTLWSFVFEPNTLDVQYQLEAELRRVATLDPRMLLNSVRSYPQENGILVELEIAVAPFNNAQTLSMFLNQSTLLASTI